MIISRRTGLVAAAATLAAAATGASSPVLAEAAPGKPAPDFTATDMHGKAVTLASFKGRVVVLEWTNEGCPYVRKHYGAGNMQALQSVAAEKGVAWLTVMSSAPGQQGHFLPLEAQAWVESQKARPTTFLLDPEGTLGRLYGARTTPHMFVIDREGVLVYAGAIDDKPTANPADIKGARNYVSEALEATLAGKPVKTASTRAYGCSIKYAAPKS